MWSSYPPDHAEKKYAGTCLWFRIRLHEDEVYEERVGEAHTSARRAKVLAYIGITLSVLGLAWNIIKAFL